jgi:hypothetical protein
MNSTSRACAHATYHNFDVYPSVHVFFQHMLHPSLYLSTYLSIYPSVHVTSIPLSIYRFIYLSIYLYICLSACVSLAIRVTVYLRMSPPLSCLPPRAAAISTCHRRELMGLTNCNGP